MNRLGVFVMLLLWKSEAAAFAPHRILGDSRGAIRDASRFSPLQRDLRELPAPCLLLHDHKKTPRPWYHSTSLSASAGTSDDSPSQLNKSLLQQTILNQALIGTTIWIPGGWGNVCLREQADWTMMHDVLVMAVIGTLPLLFLSRQIENSEDPAVSDINLSTNIYVLRLFGDTPIPVTAFVVSSFLALLTAVVEETTFRGLLLNNLSEQYHSALIGTIFSTFVFAALHVNPIGLVRGGVEARQDALVLLAYQLITGSTFAFLYLLSGNLAVPIVAHALYDFSTFFFTHLKVTTQMDYAKAQQEIPTASRWIEQKWLNARGAPFVQACKQSFYLADQNRDGVLSRRELRIAVASFGLRLSEEESEAVVSTADVDQSGAIDLDEFLEFVGPSGSPSRAIKNSLLGVN